MSFGLCKYSSKDEVFRKAGLESSTFSDLTPVVVDSS